MISNVFLKTAYKSLIQEVVEGIPIRVFWKDRECRYLGCNSLFAQDAGFSHSSDLIGKTDFDMVWHAQADSYQADDQLVGDQLASIHDFLQLQAQWGAGLDGGTQHVTGGNLRNAEFLANELGLRAFAGARCAQQDQLHGVAPM